MSTSSRWRRARDFVVGLTMLVVLAWALPRVDTSDGMRALSTIVIGVTGSAVWAVHEQRILRRSPRQQARVALEMMAAVGLWGLGFCVPSLTLGASPARITGILSGVPRPTGQEPLFLPAVLVVFTSLALLAYRSRKKRDAELHRQAESEAENAAMVLTRHG